MLVYIEIITPQIISSLLEQSSRRPSSRSPQFSATSYVLGRLSTQTHGQTSTLKVLEIGLLAILILYEILLGWVCIAQGLSNNIQNTIGVKQGFPLPLSFFGLYIDGMDSFILESTNELSCLLHGSGVPIHHFADDIVLLSHTTKGLQGFMDALDSFTARQELVANLSKTNVLAFNVSKTTMIKLRLPFETMLSRLPPPTLSQECSSLAPDYP